MFSKLRFATHVDKIGWKRVCTGNGLPRKARYSEEFGTFRIFPVEYYHLVTPFNQRFDSLWEQITVADGHEGMVVYTKEKYQGEKKVHC